MNQQAYNMGFAIGIMKTGSVEKIERQNTALRKIAELLHKKGVKKFAAVKSADNEFDPTNLEHQRNLRKEVARQTAEIAAGAGEDSPRSETAEFGRQFKRRGAAAVRELGAKANKLKESMPYRAAQSGKEPKVIDLELSPEELRRYQRPGGFGGGGGGRDARSLEERRRKFDEEEGFYGGPQFGDIRKFWMQLLGMTPSQMRAGQVAREAGYGRALQHKANLDWIRAMLLGPQMGHYGMAV